jgi:hypothetical protein
MNTDRYRLTKRGRKAKRPELRGWGGNVKLTDSKRIGLYIDDKHGGILSQYWLTQGRYNERQESERRAKEEADKRLTEQRSESRKAIAAVFIGRHRQN